MRILFLGDIVGRPGREAVKAMLPGLRATYKPDFVLANVENIVHGAGVRRDRVEELLKAGLDGCTSGDHAFDIPGADTLFSDPALPIVRPANLREDLPGHSFRILEKEGRNLLLMNILGRVFMRHTPSDPFEGTERMLANAREHGSWHVSLLDVHAEATSEKRAIAETFDGMIDVIVGTHSHVQTNDPQILPRGTAFLTDCGMCGPERSIIGLDIAKTLEKFREGSDEGNVVASGPCRISGSLITIEGTRREVRLINVSCQEAPHMV